MMHSIKCKICGCVDRINGQKQIDLFHARHQHEQPWTEYMTGRNLELDNPQDRIQLKIDAPELITHR